LIEQKIFMARACPSSRTEKPAEPTTRFTGPFQGHVASEALTGMVVILVARAVAG